jgi:hypothetical protein
MSASRWRLLAVVASAFVLGILFERLARPWLARDVDVWVIHGKVGEGCKGSWGSTKIRFGRGIGHTDGIYEIPCEELSPASETAALVCHCE